MPAPRKYPKEVRRGAVRLVTDARRDPATAPGAIARIARQLDINKGALRNWVRQAEIDTGDRPGQTSDDKARIAQLERENFELRRANDILKAASAFFAYVAAPSSAADVGRPSEAVRLSIAVWAWIGGDRSA